MLLGGITMEEKVALSELNNIFHARRFAYDILRRFFVEEPSKEYLKPFIQKNMIDLFPFREDSEEIQEGVNKLKSYLSTHDVLTIEHHYDDLHWDYTRLFIGPFKLTTPPWESSYVRKDRLLFQGTTMNVRSYYDKYGIIVRDFNIEADDHIGLELDFIYHLNERCIKMAEQNESRGLRQLLRDQQRFIDDHLLKFVPEFSRLVMKEANTSFYSGLAQLLQHYLLIDSEVLQELMTIDNL